MNKSISFGVFSSFIAYAMLLFGSVVQSAFVIRYLSTVDAGIWFLFLGIFTFINLCDFGLSPTLSRELGLASYKRNRVYRERLLYTTVLKLNHILSILVCLGLCIIFLYIYFQKNIEPHVIYAFILFSLAVIVRFLTNPPMAFIYGYGHVSMQKWLLAMTSAINAFLGALVLWYGGGLISISATYLASFTLLFLTASLYVRYHFKMRITKMALQITVIKRLLEPCLQWTIMSLGAVLILQIDTFVVAGIVGIAEVAAFAVIKQLCTAMMGLSSIFNAASVPFISMKKGHSDEQGVYRLFLFNVKFASMLAVFTAIFIIFNHQQVGHFWLGKDFQFNFALLVIMFITTILEAHHVSCAQVTMASGYVKFARIALIGGVVNIILSLTLAHYYGVIGVGAALLIAQLLTNNWYVVKVSLRFLKISYKNYFILVLQLIIYLVVDIMFNYLLYMVMPIFSDFFYLLMCGVLNLIFFCLFILTMHNERQIICQFIKRRLQSK
ncbi:oligosaccharide flippase family protein [Thiotrichales bacterium 19S3-7]|nr:oligosaccharide flippase family protein [Thiotrichales bacterium 19S3-7]MCF6800698.1 oligosaccharide flippase family protein [Thiotrichales bacterium 19S3-11]